jgi:hypothetical protein
MGQAIEQRSGHLGCAAFTVAVAEFVHVNPQRINSKAYRRFRRPLDDGGTYQRHTVFISQLAYATLMWLRLS